MYVCIHNLFNHIGFHVVKRHYGNLCSCFPSNYKKTVQKLQRLIDLDQEDMVLIISPTGDHPSDPVAVNQRVLMHLFLYCQSDEDLLKICSYLEELVDPTKRLSVDEFRRGKLHCVISKCVFVVYICSPMNTKHTNA